MLNKYYETTWKYVQGRQSIWVKPTKLRKFLGKNENSDIQPNAQKFIPLTIDKASGLGGDFGAGIPTKAAPHHSYSLSF